MWYGWSFCVGLMSVHSSIVPSRGWKTGLLGKMAPLIVSTIFPVTGSIVSPKVTVRCTSTGRLRRSW